MNSSTGLMTTLQSLAVGFSLLLKQVLNREGDAPGCKSRPSTRCPGLPIDRLIN